MLCIGITGGISAGKSTATDIFSSLNVPIIDADTIARALTASGQPALNQIAQHFGQQILDENRHLNRSALKEIIFSQPEEKNWLEALLHPLIIDEINRQKQHLAAPYCIVSAPLLMEAQIEHTLVERILVIDADPKIQIERTKTRDHLSETEIAKIMHAQLSREQRLAKADEVIENNTDVAALRLRIEALHQRYLALSHTKGFQ
jgi:dephospho-CoA kinase